MFRQINCTNFKPTKANSLEAGSSLLKIYKSSAGSGKTYQLVLNYLTLVLKSNNPDKFKRILAITFTNKAAQEMKARVLSGLRKLIDGKDTQFIDDYIKSTGLPAHELEEKAKILLSNILHNYGNLHILTIDKFVHKIIRSFSKELGLTTNFELTFDFESITTRCVDEVLQDLGNDEQLTKILIEYYRQLIDQENNPNIEKALIERAKILNQEEAIEKLAFYTDKNLDFFVNIRKDIRGKIKELIQSALQNKKRIIQLFGDELDFIKNGSTKAFNSILIGWENSMIPEPYSESQLTKATNEEWLSNSKAKTLPNLVSLLEVHGSELSERLININKVILKISFLENLDRNIMSFALLNDVQQQLNNYKKDNNVVFIGELNRIITDIIGKESAPYIYEKIGTRFENYFVDEFQDTSELQWKNLVPLIHDSLSNGNENLIVGDAKQSIYRWRGGNAQQFIDLPIINFNMVDIEDINRSFDYHKFVDKLDDNYRSSQSIITFNNWYFQGIRDLSDSTLISKMYSDAFQNQKRQLNGYVEVVIKKPSAEYNIEVPYDIDLIRQINDCLEDGYSFKDICILVRTNKGGSEIAQFLMEKDIPVTSQDSLLLGESELIKLLHALLMVLHHETEENVLRLFSHFRSRSLMELFESYRIPSDKNTFYNSGYDLGKFLQLEIPSFNRNFYSQLSIFDQLDYLIKILDISREDLYVDRLLNATHEFQQRFGHQTSRFLNYLQDKILGSSVVPSESSNAVNVMTIHKSKGLQFPVVIIPKKIDNNDQDNIWLSGNSISDLGLTSIHMRPSKDAPDEEIKTLQEEHKELIAIDILNMIYVAYTRAEDRLYIHFVEYNSSNSVKQQIGLIESHPEYNSEKALLTIGKRENNTNEIKASAKLDFVISTKNTINWREILILATTPSNLTDDSTNFNEKNWGITIHKILQEINNLKNWENSISRFVQKNKEWISYKEDIRQVIAQYVDNDIIKELYNDIIEIYSERDLGAGTGKILRPDKVIIKNHETIVIDFKTGNALPKHKEQILSYGEVLRRIYNQPIKLYLIYLSNNKITVLHV